MSAACPTPSCTATSTPVTGVATAARRSSWTSLTLMSAIRCWTDYGPVTSCPRVNGLQRPGPGSMPGHRFIPGCEPARALRIAEPLAHLTYAVRYQEFLDGIEPSERIYHRGDPAAAVRAALRSATP